MMRRREFITLFGGTAVAWPVAARAQQAERVRRIGALIVFSENDPSSQRRTAAFQQGLAKLGWIVGRNLQIDYRWDISDEREGEVRHYGIACTRPGSDPSQCHRCRGGVSARDALGSDRVYRG